MKESKVEAHLVAVVKEHGGEVRKMKWIGRRGAPDRLVLLPGRHFAVELKRPRKTFEAHQRREAARLQAADLDVLLFDTIEKIDNFFNQPGV